jgi:hypothetical protein
MLTSQGNTIIVQKALGQQNIDDLLKLSDDYKKSEPPATYCSAWLKLTSQVNSKSLQPAPAQAKF